MSDEVTPQGTITLDQAVERLMKADDTAAEAAQPEETGATDNSDGMEAEAGEAPETGDNSQEPGEPSIEVDFDGAKRKLTAKEIRDGFLMRQDYSRKTAEVAEEKRAAAAERENAEALRTQLEEALQVWAVPTEQEPNWPELAKALDPRDYNARRAAWEDRQKNAAVAADHFRRMREAQTAKAIADERAKLLEAVPDFRDDAVFQAASVKMRAAGREYGFSEQELNAMGDHRLIRALNDLVAFKAMKAAAEKKVATAPAALKPGSKPTQSEQTQADRQKQREQFRKTGRIEDALALIMRPS
jgi:hypothetical protein